MKRFLRKFHRSGTPAAPSPAACAPEPTVKPGVEPFLRFLSLYRQAGFTRVLECGTLQSQPGRPTHHMGHFPGATPETYVKTDIFPGPDVDVVADLHCLPWAWTGRFHGFIAVAVWEHLQRPWVAARETARVLAPGGLAYVCTHQCFPLHGYPSDYFRFSKEALALIFADAGLEILSADYDHRCMIVPPADVVPPEGVAGWNREFPSYILVSIVARKP